MNRNQFEQHLNESAIKWFVGTDHPTLTGAKAGKFVTRGPEEGGYHQVIKFKPQTEFCTDCCKSVTNRVKTINLKTGGHRCSCGLTFPENNSISNTDLNIINK